MATPFGDVCFRGNSGHWAMPTAELSSPHSRYPEKFILWRSCLGTCQASRQLRSEGDWCELDISRSAKNYALKMFTELDRRPFIGAAEGGAYLERVLEPTLVHRQAHDVGDVPNHVARVAEQFVGRDEEWPYAEQRKRTSETSVLTHEEVQLAQCLFEKVVKIFGVPNDRWERGARGKIPDTGLKR